MSNINPTEIKSIAYSNLLVSVSRMTEYFTTCRKHAQKKYDMPSLYLIHDVLISFKDLLLVATQSIQEIEYLNETFEINLPVATVCNYYKINSTRKLGQELEKLDSIIRLLHEKQTELKLHNSAKVLKEWNVQNYTMITRYLIKVQ